MRYLENSLQNGKFPIKIAGIGACLEPSGTTGDRGPEIGSEPLTPPPSGSQNFHTRSEPRTQGGGRKPTASEPLTRPPFHPQTLALSKSTCYKPICTLGDIVDLLCIVCSV